MFLCECVAYVDINTSNEKGGCFKWPQVLVEYHQAKQEG